MSQDRNISYLNKDFNDFKNSLVNYTKAYFPNTYNDFSPSSTGMMFMELSSYVGDVLSFYLDNQFQENLFLYTKEKENGLAMAYTLGYKPKASYASSGKIDIYQLLPAINDGTLKPNWTYALVFPENTVLGSTSYNNSTFLTTEEIDFSDTGSVEVTYLEDSNLFLAKKSTSIISGEIKTATFTFGAPQKFSTITLNDTNILQILSIQGNDASTWYEVPYLAQETIQTKTSNPSVNTDNVPYLLSLTKTPNRFTTRLQSDGTYVIEFGAGMSTNSDLTILPNPDNVQLGLVPSISGEENKYNKASVFFSKEYGVAPANVTLTVTYIVGGGINSNAPANSINVLNDITNINYKTTPTPGNPSLESTIRNTTNITVTNPEPTTGGRDGDTLDEIKLNTLYTFASQNRTVTKDDYVTRALSMPSIYGTIAKAYVTQDMFIGNENDSLIDRNPLALSLYVLGYDSNKKLTLASSNLKNNLKQYLSQYRMMADAITIKNAYYINLLINFDITTLSGYNNKEVLQNCINTLKDYFNIEKWSINQPIILSDIYAELLKVKGVLSIVKLEFTNKQASDGTYSLYGYDIKAATRNGIIYPSVDPSIFEIRNPDLDISGRVVYV